MSAVNDFRLIASDIDGTLVVRGKVVSPELKGIFAELRRRGVAVTLCTGRMPHHTVKVADELGVTDYLICIEGGHLFHRPTGERIHYAAMDGAVTEKVGRLVASHPEAEMAAMAGDTIWVTTERAAQRAHFWGSQWRLTPDARTVPQPILFVLFGPHQLMGDAAQTLRRELPEDLFVHGVENMGGYAHFKVCRLEADKGIAAERLVRHLGGERSHILAFGDGLNDLGIMKHAGCSICPPEAHPLIRGAATRVSPHSAEQGFVARELKRIFGLE